MFDGYYPDIVDLDIENDKLIFQRNCHMELPVCYRIPVLGMNSELVSYLREKLKSLKSALVSHFETFLTKYVFLGAVSVSHDS